MKYYKDWDLNKPGVAMNDVKRSLLLFLAVVLTGCSAPSEPAKSPDPLIDAEEEELPPTVYESPLPENLQLQAHHRGNRAA